MVHFVNYYYYVIILLLLYYYLLLQLTMLAVYVSIDNGAIICILIGNHDIIWQYHGTLLYTMILNDYHIKVPWYLHYMLFQRIL